MKNHGSLRNGLKYFGREIQIKLINKDLSKNLYLSDFGLKKKVKIRHTKLKDRAQMLTYLFSMK